MSQSGQPIGVQVAGGNELTDAEALARARRMAVAAQNGFLPGFVPGDPPAPGAELFREGLGDALDVGIAAGTTLVPGGRAVEGAAALAGTKLAIGGARTAAVLERVVGTRVGAALFSSRGGLLNTGVFRVGVSTKFGQPQFRIAIGGGRDPFLKIDLGSSLSKFF